RATVFGQVNDASTGGTLPDDLMQGSVSLEISDGGTFRTKTVLTGCKKRPSGAIRCLDKATHTRATFRPVGSPGRLPHVYRLHFMQQHLDTTQTGGGMPSGPVGVILHQGMVDRPCHVQASQCGTEGSSLLCHGS